MAHTNFVWCAISALFILFIISTTFLIEQIWGKASSFSEILVMPIKLPGAKLAILGVVLGLHLVSGLYWYYVHITARTMGDIISGKW